jgi:hypothetical protein
MLSEGLLMIRTTPPTQKLIAEWVFAGMQNMLEQMVRNAWLHHDYPWFVPTVSNGSMVMEVTNAVAI